VSFTVHKDVMVAMRDGVELATDLWVPDATPAPTLLVRLPYSKDLPGLLGYGLVPNLFALVEAGYAVVYQDCRGTFRSAGDFTPMLTEPDDGADTVVHHEQFRRQFRRGVRTAAEDRLPGARIHHEGALQQFQQRRYG
jgi:hypothetical protein